MKCLTQKIKKFINKIKMIKIKTKSKNKIFKIQKKEKMKMNFNNIIYPFKCE